MHEIFLVFILTGYPGRRVISVSRLSTQPARVFRFACLHVRRPAWVPEARLMSGSGGGARCLVSDIPR